MKYKSSSDMVHWTDAQLPVPPLWICSAEVRGGGNVVRRMVVVVVLLLYVHGKHRRSCRDGQLT